MQTTDFELTKDYDRKKLCKYYSNLCELKEIDFFNPVTFWQYVKVISKYNPIEIKIKSSRFGKKRFYIRPNCIIPHSAGFLRGEYFEDLEYGILYIFAKTLREIIKQTNYLLLKHPNAKIDKGVWENFKREILEIAFQDYLNKKGE